MADAFSPDYPRLAVVVVLVAVNLALVAALSTSGAAYGPYNDDWDGAGTLRDTASESADTHLAITARPYQDVGAGESLAVALAPSAPASGAAASVRGYLARGGTLVVAGQNATRTNAYLAAVGASARVDGRPLRDERNNYRAEHLPIAGNVTDHPLTGDAESLTLNSATAVRPRGATPLANTSAVAYLDANGNGSLDESDPLGPFPVATVESVGTGRVVVVSDPSVFTNAMLEREGNRAFLAALLDGRSDVVLDYQSGPLPPLVYGLLAVRASPLVQFVVGVATFAGFALWVVRDRILTTAGRVRTRLPGVRSGREPPEIRLDADSIEALLADRHPEWDPERTERVTEAVLRQQRGRDDDE